MLKIMRLYLIQHGDAVPKEEDTDRPLSDGGREDVQRLAEMLAASAIQVSHVFHSGKTRARQTAEILAPATASGVSAAPTDGLNPNDPVEPIAEKASALDRDVLLVGHQPFLGRLVAHLVTGSEEIQTVAFRPGSLVCLEGDETGGWMVAWMVRPELLK